MMSKDQQPAGEELSVEEAFARLEELCQKLESRDVSLETSFLLFQEGMGLCRLATEKLDTVEKKMLQLNEDGSLVEFQR